MRTSPWWAALALGILLAAACGRQDSADEAFSAIEDTVYGEQTRPEDRVALARSFLEKFPESDHTESLLGLSLYYLVEELDDLEGAHQLVTSLKARVHDAGLLKAIQVEEVQVLGRMGKTDQLRSLVAELLAQGPLSYQQHSTIARAGSDSELWDLALVHAEEGLNLATEQAFKQEYSGRSVPEKRIKMAVRRRNADSLDMKGWALSNLGRVDEGIEAFEAAKEFTTFNYIGVPSNDLNLHWAATHMKLNHYDEAMELLAPQAVFGGGGQEVTALMKEAFAAKTGKMDGFDAYLEAQRSKRARAVAGFSLPTYQGEALHFDRLKQDKVTLLTFWFPS